MCCEPRKNIFPNFGVIVYQIAHIRRGGSATEKMPRGDKAGWVATNSPQSDRMRW